MPYKRQPIDYEMRGNGRGGVMGCGKRKHIKRKAKRKFKKMKLAMGRFYGKKKYGKKRIKKIEFGRAKKLGWI